jgi:hypothetical protein
MLEVLQGRARRFIQKALGPIDFRQTGLESVAIAQVEGEGDEATRAGIRFHMSATLATGQAVVQAFPTTTAAWLLYNPTNNPITAFIDVLGALAVSGTPAATYEPILLGCIVPAGNIPTTIPTLTANVQINNANPISAKKSSIVVASAQTLQATAGANSWFPITYGTNGVLSATASVPQNCVESRDIRGKFCVPPGGALGLSVIAPAGTTTLYAPYASWREYAADME